MSQKTELSMVAVNLVSDASNWLQITKVNDLSGDRSTIDSPVTDDISSEPVILSHTSNHILGFVALNSMSIKLTEFRVLMAQQIRSLPDSFIFLSKEGLVPNCC